MRVATFNICHGSRGKGTEVDWEAVVEACVALDADVLALQEVDREVDRSGRIDQPASIAEACGMACVFGPVMRLGGGEFGNALLVRGSIDAVELVALRGRARLGGRNRRGAVVATATTGGVAVAVAVTHLSVAVLDNFPQLAKAVAALRARPGPRLLMGDLNRRTAWVRPAVEAGGLALAVDDEPTAPATRPRYRIDHIAAHGLRIASVEVVDTGTSDHRALVAELELPAAGR